MKARHAARELALLVLFQLGKQGSVSMTTVDSPDHETNPEESGSGEENRVATEASELFEALSNKDMEQLLLDAVRALVDQADEQIRTAAQEIAEVSQCLLDTELEHPDNLATPLGTESRPVPIPTTRAMIEKLEQVLLGAENLAEAIRIPELAALSKAPMVRQYALMLVKQALMHQPEIDRLIGQASEAWKLHRLVKIDRDILRLAVAEMCYVPEVDPEVSIDEAVTLAKRFSTEESYRFINGVLGQIAGQIADQIAGQASDQIPEQVAQPVAGQPKNPSGEFPHV